MSRTVNQQMLDLFEGTYPQAPITGQRALQYGAWMMDEGRVLAYHRRDNGCTNGQLRRFYESFGFERSESDPGYFYRTPHSQGETL